MKRIILPFVMVAAFLLSSAAAYAQTSTTGAVRGVVKDETGSAIIGATVVATSPVLQGTQAELTDSDGVYFIANLPPGAYEVTVFFGDGKWSRQNVLVNLGAVAKINIDINTSAAGSGETIVVEGTAPVIDQGSTKTGAIIDENYTRRIPTGRTFQGTIGAAAGSQGDLYGVSFGGSTSVENQYIVEGVNTTDPAFGLASTNLPNEFVRQTEVITGGYNAEFGRSTGAVVNVVTKSGGNEFHGSVFAYFTPGALSPTPRELPREGSSIVSQSELDFNTSFGGEVGGPIIKDKLWFHVGFNPVFTSRTVSRGVKTFIDENQDGIPDTDENGFSITREVRSTDVDTSAQEYLYHGKLTFAATPDHQGSFSLFGNPGTQDTYRTLTGNFEDQALDIEDGAYDVSAKWTSKFNDNKSQVDAVVGFHRNRLNELPVTDLGDSNQVRFDNVRQLSGLATFEPGGVVPSECVDGDASDPFPMIDNCPVQFYNIGGIGFRELQETDRISAGVKFTQRVKAAGRHQFKVGADIEQMSYIHLSDFTGGQRFRYRDTSVRIDRFFTVRDNAMPSGGIDPLGCGEDLDGDGVGDATCEFQPDGLNSDTTSQSLSFFAQDTWSILPNLTLNAGIRWEQQTAYVAEDVQGQISPTTGEPIPEKAFELNNMLAPRLGVIYDWTEEGRSKVFAHWGRFYEMVPMDINARAYGGEVFAVDVVPFADVDGDGTIGCTDPDVATMSPGDVGCDFGDSVFTGLFGGGEEVVVPGLEGQYLDEVVAGVEYELFEDFKLGGTYIYRTLGRVIEDVSVDGANTYIVANPGEPVSSSDIQAIREEAAAAAAAGDMNRANFLANQANSFQGVNRFDEPVRRYNALQVTAEKRFSRDLMVLASYTLSKTEGNFPGLFSPDTGQLDPNLTSMYDLPELMANRYGDLPQDKPHLLKLDGFYLLNAGENVGDFIFGGSIRAASGRPINTLGGHPLYGFGESYILPRGNGAEGDRTEFTTSFDARVTYGRQISDTMRIEGFFDIFNLINTETTLSVDENYTFDDVNPVVGGDKEDLAHLKPVGTAGNLVEVNPNYANPTGDQAVRSFRFGMRLTF